MGSQGLARQAAGLRTGGFCARYGCSQPTSGRHNNAQNTIRRNRFVTCSINSPVTDSGLRGYPVREAATAGRTPGGMAPRARGLRLRVPGDVRRQPAARQHVKAPVSKSHTAGTGRACRRRRVLRGIERDAPPSGEMACRGDAPEYASDRTGAAPGVDQVAQRGVRADPTSPGRPEEGVQRVVGQQEPGLGASPPRRPHYGPERVDQPLAVGKRA